MTKDRKSHHKSHKLPLRRYGEFVGRASAGLIIVGTASFALAAMMLDLL